MGLSFLLLPALVAIACADTSVPNKPGYELSQILDRLGTYKSYDVFRKDLLEAKQDARTGHEKRLIKVMEDLLPCILTWEDEKHVCGPDANEVDYGEWQDLAATLNAAHFDGDNIKNAALASKCAVEEIQGVISHAAYKSCLKSLSPRYPSIQR